MKRNAFATLPLLAAAALASADGGAEWGKQIPADRDSALSVSYGTMFGLKGHVDETFRAFYRATGQDSKQALAESYSLEDFGVDDAYTVYGLRYEERWSLFDLRCDLTLLSLDADADARRDYYIGLGDEIKWGGRSFDHLKIPKGTHFSIDFSGALLSVEGAFTPVSLLFGDDIRLTPELDFGLVLVGGRYKVDAGPTRGAAVYQNPPVDFAVGGHSSSFIGAGAPMVGLGAELRVGPDDWVQWITRANIGYFSYDGSTKPFTSSSHREKEIELGYLSLAFDTSVVLPMDESTCLQVGLRLQYMDIDAEIRSKDRDVASIVAARERFDKSADFKAFTALLYAGVTF